MPKKSPSSPQHYSRRIAPPPSWYEQHGISTDPPPPGALFWELWQENMHLAEQALQTDFIQGIRAGNLDPNQYGSYTVMDAYYCFSAAEDYGVVASRCSDHPNLLVYLTHKHESYQKYNASFSQQWGIGSGSCLLPNEAVSNYSALESQVCQQEDPIYALVVMLPCEYLWYWLSDQIRAEATESNLYAFWIKGNLDPSGAYAMGNELEAYLKDHPGGIDRDKARRFYTQAMQGELGDFAASKAD